MKQLLHWLSPLLSLLIFSSLCAQSSFSPAPILYGVYLQSGTWQETSSSHLIPQFPSSIHGEKAPRVAQVQTHEGKTLARFFYQESEEGTLTQVENLYGGHTCYHFDAHGWLCAQEDFLSSTDLLRRQEFRWCATPVGPQLEQLLLKDAQGAVHWAQTHHYDDQGRLIKKRLFGDFTGQAPHPLQLNSHGAPSKKNNLFLTYSYHYEENQLCSVEDSLGHSTQFHTSPSGALLSRLFFQKGALYKREFFTYDREGRLLEKIVDDGSVPHLEDDTGVTTRTLLRNHFHLEGAQVRATLTQMFRMDVETGKGLLEKSTYTTQNERGQILSQEHLLPLHPQVHSLPPLDTPLELALAEQELQSSTTFLYDSEGRLKEKVDQSSGVQTHSHYTPNGKLAFSTQQRPGLPLAVKRYQYDPAGQLISEENEWGHTLTHLYDGLGREVTTHLPPIPVGDEKILFPKRSVVYDIFDRIQTHIDEKGHAHHLTYTATGQPTHILFPDGSSLSHHYHPNGTKARTWTQEGLQLSYHYDLWNNLTSTHFTSQEGVEIQTQQKAYNKGQLTSTLHPNGSQEHYQYNGLGQLTETLLDDGEQFLGQTFHYSSLGQLNATTLWQEEASTSLSFSSLPSLSFHQEERWIHTQVVPFSHATGMILPQLIQTDREGNQQKTLYAPCGKVLQKELIDGFGQTLSKQRLTYDEKGQVVEEQFGQETSTLQRDHDAMGRLIALREGVGTSLERETRWSYTPSGQLASQTHPDGTTLTYHYDPWLRLSRILASDGSVDQQFFYNDRGELIATQDPTQSSHTLREYNGKGELCWEQMGNGHTLTTERDLMGRVTQLTLTDGSQVHYQYGKKGLKKISRYNAQGKKLYSSRQKRNEAGQLLTLHLPQKAGTIHFEPLPSGEYAALSHPHFSQRVEREKQRGSSCITESQWVDATGPHSTHYSYDSLGQLTEEKEDSSLLSSFDSLLNPKVFQGEKAQTNALQSLISLGEDTFSYDLRGNLTTLQSGKEQWLLSYDALNRLQSLTHQSGARWEWDYDCFHRRIRETHTLPSGEKKEQHFLYWENNEMGAHSPEEGIHQLRLLLPTQTGEMGATLAMELQGELYAPIHDLQGSIRALVHGPTGELRESYQYSAFGREQRFDPEGAPLATPPLSPWRFCGKRVDNWGGVFFGRRHFSPQMGRWTSCDPMGYLESPNLYAYTLNNPLSYRDPYGLFSIGEVWSALFNFGKELFGSTRQFSQSIGEKVHLIEQMGREFESIGVQFIGEFLFTAATGSLHHHTDYGILGEGEVSDQIRITYINGMLNAKHDCLQAAEAISQSHGDCNVHYIFSASSGFTWDIFKGMLGKSGYTSHQAQLLAHTWKGMIGEMGGPQSQGKIIHYAHSLGGLDTMMAETLLSPEEKRMIEVCTFGSASLIAEGSFGSVNNYISVRDGIPLVDPLSYFQGLFFSTSHITFVGSYKGIPLVDHFFDSPNYQTVLELLGSSFIERYGLLRPSL